MFSLSQTQHSLTVTWNQQQVLGYHFPEDGNRPFCHPLNLPGAPPLTMNEPGDHVHHQGLWVAWKKVNEVNFWEQPGPGSDPTGFGKIVHQRIVSQKAEADSATSNNRKRMDRLARHNASHGTTRDNSSIHPQQTRCRFPCR